MSKAIMVVGICGKARAGKDTAGAYLSKKLGIPTVAFADALKLSAVAMFGITSDMAYGINYDREQIVEHWGISVREMLQKLGTECAREVFRDDFWVRRLQQLVRIDPCYSEGFIVTDVRFDNEAQWVLDMGGKMVHISRRDSILESADGHSSEDGVNPNLVNSFVSNDHDVQDLHIVLDCLKYE